MSYQEKRTLTSIMCGVVLLVAYCTYSYTQIKSGSVNATDLHFWASTMLTFIAAGIVLTIVSLIIFHILLSISIAIAKRDAGDKEVEKSIKIEMIEDERDSLIELKSSRASAIFTGVGFIAGLISLVLNYSPALMLNIIFLSTFVGNIFDGILQMYYYRKG